MSAPIVVVYKGGKYNKPREVMHTLARFRTFLSVKLATLGRTNGAAAKAAGISGGRWSIITRHEQINEDNFARIAQGVDMTSGELVEAYRRWEEQADDR